MAVGVDVALGVDDGAVVALGFAVAPFLRPVTMTTSVVEEEDVEVLTF